jgi:phosphoketolase
MRSLKDILLETKKTYAFKIGVAGDLPEGFSDMLETALDKYQVVKMSTGKKTPIQERPLDFPQLQNMEVTYFEVEVNYPTTTQVLQEYLGSVCKVPKTRLVVRNPNEPVERIQNTKTEQIYEPILTKEDMGGESAQSNVANNRVMDLLKELETARKERTDPVADTPKGKESKMEEKTNNKSVVGS